MKKLLITTISAFISWGILLTVLAGPAAAAGNTVMNVSATILSKSNCSFKTAAANIPFGALDPVSMANVAASASAVFTCKGSDPVVVYAISQDSGLYSTGPGGNRMRHATIPTAYIPYTLVISPITGSFPRETPPKNHTVTVTGTVLGTDYHAALAGTYSDTVTLTINP